MAVTTGAGSAVAVTVDTGSAVAVAVGDGAAVAVAVGDGAAVAVAVGVGSGAATAVAVRAALTVACTADTTVASISGGVVRLMVAGVVTGVGVEGRGEIVGTSFWIHAEMRRTIAKMSRDDFLRI